MLSAGSAARAGQGKILEGARESSLSSNCPPLTRSRERADGCEGRVELTWLPVQRPGSALKEVRGEGGREGEVRRHESKGMRDLGVRGNHRGT